MKRWQRVAWDALVMHKKQVNSSQGTKRGRWRLKIKLVEVVKNDMSIKKVTRSMTLIE